MAKATIKSTPKEIFYATIGAGDLAISKARKARAGLDIAQVRKGLPSAKTLRSEAIKARKRAVSKTTKVYVDLVKRGEKAVAAVWGSTLTERAVSQTKTATRQTKSAVASVRKAAVSTVETTKEAVSSL
jgi:hypothetical protein